MFAVLCASAVPDHLHGYISRFLTEVNTGVYVGKVTPRVAEALWARCDTEDREGTLTFVTSNPNYEQGFMVQSRNHEGRQAIDLDGIWLGTSTINQA